MAKKNDNHRKHSGKKDGNRSKRKYSAKPRPFERKSKAPLPKTDTDLVRLNRYLANAGICSRRDADDLIKAGLVEVNGKVVTEMGFKVKPDDKVKYAGETISAEKKVYVLLNKPKDFITTKSDPQNRRTVMHLLKGVGKERIYPVGRLDRMTTGLLLFTNDGQLAKKLTHPRHGVKKLYHVHLDKAVNGDHLKEISEGVKLEDGMMKADDISFVGNGNDKKQVGIEIHSGKNRIVRRLFESFGYKVIKLDRVSFAGLTKKDLPRGKWRFLKEQEVSMLKMLK